METKITVWKDCTINITWIENGEFGNIYIFYDDKDQLKIGSEYMDKKFVKRVLCNVVDNAILVE